MDTEKKKSAFVYKDINQQKASVIEQTLQEATDMGLTDVKGFLITTPLKCKARIKMGKPSFSLAISSKPVIRSGVYRIPDTTTNWNWSKIAQSMRRQAISRYRLPKCSVFLNPVFLRS